MRCAVFNARCIVYTVLDEELKTNVGGGDESRWNDKEHVSADDLTKKKTMPYPGFEVSVRNCGMRFRILTESLY